MQQQLSANILLFSGCNFPDQLMFLFSLQEDDQRLKSLPVRTVEHILALLPASIGNTPRDQAPADARSVSELTGADVRMSAASTIANLSQSLTNRYGVFPMPSCILLDHDTIPCIFHSEINAIGSLDCEHAPC